MIVKLAEPATSPPGAVVSYPNTGAVGSVPASKYPNHASDPAVSS